jgi:hypothetical protein
VTAAPMSDQTPFKECVLRKSSSIRQPHWDCHLDEKRANRGLCVGRNRDQPWSYRYYEISGDHRPACCWRYACGAHNHAPVYDQKVSRPERIRILQCTIGKPFRQWALRAGGSALVWGLWWKTEGWQNE